MKPLLVLLLAGVTATALHAQKKERLEDKATIQARAHEALDAALLPGGKLHAAVIKEDLIGQYVVQVSFREKGIISSVFVVSAEAHDIRSQNRFKDLLHQHKLPFIMPKGRQYRIEHAFDLNHIKHHHTSTETRQ